MCLCCLCSVRARVCRCVCLYLCMWRSEETVRPLIPLLSTLSWGRVSPWTRHLPFQLGCWQDSCCWDRPFYAHQGLWPLADMPGLSPGCCLHSHSASVLLKGLSPRPGLLSINRSLHPYCPANTDLLGLSASSVILPEVVYLGIIFTCLGEIKTLT